jgi:hypothetical protein
MRRYAHELNFSIPEEEVAEIWRVFSDQTADMQQGMIERYTRTTRGDFEIRKKIETSFQC